jgi:hypothetical protein
VSEFRTCAAKMHRTTISVNEKKVCIYVHTCYVLTKPPIPIYYVLAAVFASCFYVLKSLLHE